MCDEIKDKGGRFQCGHAVLMEPQLQTSPPVFSVPEDMPAFCGGVAGVYQRSCYIFTGFLTYAKLRDPVTAIQACNKIPTEFQRECSERTGEALYVALQNPERITKSCEDGGKIQQVVRWCLRGANMTAVHSLNGLYGDMSVLICGAASSPFARTCYEDVSNILYLRYGQEIKDKFCGQLPDMFMSACLQVGTT